MAFQPCPVVTQPRAISRCCGAPYRNWKTGLYDCSSDTTICECWGWTTERGGMPLRSAPHLLEGPLAEQAGRLSKSGLELLPEVLLHGRLCVSPREGFVFISVIHFPSCWGACGLICPCLLACKVALEFGECCCVPCLPGALVAMRTGLREQLRIQVPARDTAG
ncbi:hypothetical protein lerEdw1_009980 [Lerista edwardsae]|nr:hypothetical protein lerEdw1_009980 [Lerista edwardsae]